MCQVQKTSPVPLLLVITADSQYCNEIMNAKYGKKNSHW